MQDKLKVAVLGARGIGKYHAREFHNAGAHVVAVLGRSEKSSSEAASGLSKDFGIDNAHPYSELERLIEQEHPDIVSIATSNNSHHQYAIMALNAGCHVFLEKPITWSDNRDPISHIQKAEHLFRLADEKGKVLTVNTPLVWHFDKYVEAVNTKYPDMQFSNFMVEKMTSYISSKKVNPAVDLLPHALCYLARLDCNGQIDWDSLQIERDKITYHLKFDYSHHGKMLNVDIQVGHSREVPSDIFGFDHLEVMRVKHKSEDPNCINYELIGIENGLKILVEDPLKILVRGFYEAVEGNGKTRLLVSPQEALANFRMQCEILQRAAPMGGRLLKYTR